MKLIGWQPVEWCRGLPDRMPEIPVRVSDPVRNYSPGRSSGSFLPRLRVILQVAAVCIPRVTCEASGTVGAPKIPKDRFVSQLLSRLGQNEVEQSLLVTKGNLDLWLW